MTLPTILAYANLDRVVTLTRVTGTLDWTTWSVIEFRCPALSLTKTLALGQIVVDSADAISITFAVADFTGKTAERVYPYQVVVGSGSLRYAVPLGQGELLLKTAIA